MILLSDYIDGRISLVSGQKNVMILLVDQDADYSHWLFEARRKNLIG
jgi:hypothetical protein